MKRLLEKDTYHASDQTVKPKVVYRGVNGYRNLLDAGVNVEFNSTVSKVNMLALYDSGGSAT